MLKLQIDKQTLDSIGAHYGDIVTLGSGENPCVDMTTGFQVPKNMEFVLVPKEDKPEIGYKEYVEASKILDELPCKSSKVEGL